MHVPVEQVTNYSTREKQRAYKITKITLESFRVTIVRVEK
jgi:hypothetical protein